MSTSKGRDSLSYSIPPRLFGTIPLLNAGHLRSELATIKAYYVHELLLSNHLMGRVPVLLSRTLDPVLGVFTGLLAFYLNEHNPRTAPPPGETLLELARWKRDKWQQARQALERESKASESDLSPSLSTFAAVEVKAGTRAKEEGEV